MLIQSKNDPQFESVNLSSHTAGTSAAVEDSRPTQTRIRIRIPKQYHQEPVISRLVSHQGLTVNVNAALLGTDARADGWFDLELQGTTRQIESAFIYLAELNVEIWSRSTDPDEENW